jgi:hypothetical protein
MFAKMLEGMGQRHAEAASVTRTAFKPSVSFALPQSNTISGGWQENIRAPALPTGSLLRKIPIMGSKSWCRAVPPRW